MNAARKIDIDHRFFVGALWVVASIWLFWAVAFGIAGSRGDQSVFEGIFDMILRSAPMAGGALLVLIFPALLLWVVIWSVLQRKGFSRRQTALIASPFVALGASVVPFLLLIVEDAQYGFPAAIDLLAVLLWGAAAALPGMLTAVTYAHLAWPKQSGPERTR